MQLKRRLHSAVFFRSINDLTMFENRKLVIATKHEKEKVLAPIFQNGIGVECFIPENFDTDLMGTFTGEISRTEDAVNTLRKKCLQAMEITNCDLGIASEGSFGPHPSIFFIHADEEYLIFIDKKNKLEIIAKELSFKTNFNGSEIKSESELTEFAHLAKFPSHSLIVRKAKDDFQEIIKGVNSFEKLHSSFQFFFTKFGKAYVETDMRALYNPTRMEIIEIAAQKLLKKILCSCPACYTPGFDIIEVLPGLPCLLCSLPTRSARSHIYACKKCDCRREVFYPFHIMEEDPMYCDYCNP